MALGSGLDIRLGVGEGLPRSPDDGQDTPGPAKLKAGWNERKGRLLTEAHVRTATSHLAKLGWITAV